MTLDELKAAVNRYFDDRSRSRDETRDGLGDLIEEIRILMQCLDEDERRDQGE